jgi:hypothetical protein
MFTISGSKFSAIDIAKSAGANHKYSAKCPDMRLQVDKKYESSIFPMFHRFFFIQSSCAFSA